MKDQLDYLKRTHGVKGAFVADAEGKIMESSWEGGDENAGAEQVSGLVSLALQGIEAEGGDAREIYLTYESGRVAVRKFSSGNLVLLCASEVNMFLLQEAVKRCVAEIEKFLQEDKPVERLQKICVELLGKQSDKPLEILASAKPTSKGLHQACKEIEEYARFFIDEKRAEQVAARMREVLRKLVADNMKNKGEAE